MSKFRLSRRTMLQGAGAVLGLPLLEAMLDGAPAYAQAAMIPKRYILGYGGHSLGGESAATILGESIPATTGTGYVLPYAMQSMAALRGELAVVSGLRIPTADAAGVLPPGGKSVLFHHHGIAPMLTGMRSANGDGKGWGPSSDQLLVAQLAGATTFKSLALRVQVTNYIQAGGDGAGVSWKKAADNSIQPIVPTVSPRQLFNSLFSNFTPGLTQADRDKQLLEQQMHHSVVDRVKVRAEALRPKLGISDQKRLDLHLDEVRDLERRVDAAAPVIVGSCAKPLDPGVDPVVSSGQAPDPVTGNVTYNQNLAYSNEEARAKAFCDLLHMAMVCDLNRIATLQLTMVQSFLNALPTTGQKADLHSLSHGGFGNLTDPPHRAVAKGIAWHMKHWGYLIQKFKDTPEGGGTMLDNLAMVYTCEGGFGLDPSSGKLNSPHSSENMMVLVAGRAGGLKVGQHLVATAKHPANVILTAMRAVGYTGTALGDISGEIVGLR